MFILMVTTGVMRTCPVEFHALLDIRRVFEANVFGCIHLTQCALPLLKESKGRVINITGSAGIAGETHLTHCK